MRADPPADFRQGAGLAVKVGGFQELPLLDQPHGGGNIVVGGAGCDAGSRIGAMHAARGFQHGALGIQGDDHVFEVADALLGIAVINIGEGYAGAGFAIDS